MEARRLLASDLAPAAFSGWDGPIVVSTVAGTNTNATSITPADNVFVDWGFGNFGDANTGVNHVSQLTLNGSVVSGGTFGTLNPFTGFPIQDVALGTLAVGSYTLQMNLDVTNVIAENSETNNTFSVTFDVFTDDFGDAPTALQTGFASTYPTLLADGGARHASSPGFLLGSEVDLESDGRPSLNAKDDDLAGGTDDEDGVVINGPLVGGSTGSFDVTVTNTAGVANPYLDVWVDFNRDGDWTDGGENVFSGNVAAGTVPVNFAVPASVDTGISYARFRLHDGTTGLTPGGAASDGEVEDYTVRLSELGQFVFQGASPTENGQVQNIEPDGNITGAIEIVVTHPTNPDIMYIGGVNGGIWKTENATAANPLWVPQTDFQESLTIGALDFDPTDATNETLIAATGRFSSYGRIGGSRGDVFITTDGGDTWTNPGSAGIQGENLSAVAKRGNTIVVTSHSNGGGIFRSTNGGATFTTIVPAGTFTNDDWFDLVVDHSDPTGQRLYAAAEDRGIFRSDNFGATWTQITGPGINADMDDLLTNPSNNNIDMAVHPVTGRLYVVVLIQGQPQGIFHTNNGTAASPTWTRMDVPTLPLANPETLTNATNTTPITITATGHGLSNNDIVVVGGVLGNTAANGTFTVTVTGANTFQLNGSSGNGAYAGGGTWIHVQNPNPRAKDPDPELPGSQGAIHFSVTVDPTDEDAIYVGGDRQDRPSLIGDFTFGGAIFRGDASVAADPTTSPSPQWDHITHNTTFDPSDGTASGSSPHADSRSLAFDQNGNLIETSDGGIFKRTSPGDATGDWFSLAGNLGVIEFHDIAYDGLSNTILGGTQDNGTQVQPSENSQIWDFFSGGDGGDVEVDNITLAGSNQSIRYSSSQRLGGFRRSVWDADGNFVSQSFPSLTPINGSPALAGAFVTPVQLNAIDPTRMIIHGANTAYESLDSGGTIDALGASLTQSGISSNAIAYGGRIGAVDNPDVIYIGSGTTVFHRSAGLGPVAATTALPAGSAGSVRDIAIDPDDWETAFAVDSNEVFVTDDAGTTWASITGDLGGFGQIWSAAFIPGGIVDAIMVGTSRGVFASALDALGTWVEVGDATLPNTPAFDMDVDIADDVLVVGTLGRGAWMLDKASEVVDSLFGAAPPSVVDIQINDGSAQRSMITELTVTFDTIVDAPASAFEITNLGLVGSPASDPVTSLIVNTATVAGQTVATITFGDDGTGAGSTVDERLTTNSLANGIYELVISGTGITLPGGGTPMGADEVFGGDPAVDNFFRIYGNVSGDGNVNFGDFATDFLPAFGSMPGDAGYQDELDFDGNDNINFGDFATGFLPSFGQSAF